MCGTWMSTGYRDKIAMPIFRRCSCETQINEGVWNGFDFNYFYLDRIYGIIRNFFACGEGPFGRRPRYPNDPVNLPAHAFTQCRIFCEAQPYVHSCSISRFFSHGRRVLSNYFFKDKNPFLFIFICKDPRESVSH